MEQIKSGTSPITAAAITSYDTAPTDLTSPSVACLRTSTAARRNTRRHVIYLDNPVDLLAHRRRCLDEGMPPAIVELRLQELIPKRRTVLYNLIKSAQPTEVLGPRSQRVYTGNMQAMAAYRDSCLLGGMPEDVYEFFWLQIVTASADRRITTQPGARLQFCVPMSDTHASKTISILHKHTPQVKTFHCTTISESLIAISVHWDGVPGLAYPPALRAAMEELHEQLPGCTEMYAQLHLIEVACEVEIQLTGAFAGWDNALCDEFKHV